MPRAVRCPICKTEVSWEDNPYRPFCSERCQLVDLGAWTEGRYRIAGEKKAQDPTEENDDGEQEPS